MRALTCLSLTAALVALGLASATVNAQPTSSANPGFRPPRVIPPAVNRPIVKPDTLRRTPTNTGTGKDEKATPTAEPPKRKPGKTGGSNKRITKPKPPQPPKIPGFPNSRPIVTDIDLADGALAELADAGDYGFDPNILNVLMSAGTDDAAVEALAQRFDLTVEEWIPVELLGDAVIARMRIPDDEQLLDVMEVINTDGTGFEAIAPNKIFSTVGTIKSSQSIQFAPQRMSVDEAHKIATGSTVKIAIIDTGIDDKHVELSGSITERFDAVGAAPDAPTKHGTAMAGVIAAKDQITGIAPNVEILSAQAFAPPKKGESATGTTFAIIKSMDWAYQSGARVFNLSFAGPRDKLLIKALDALADHETIMIGAAGNAGPGKPPAYPAAHDGVIAVTATDQNDALYTMANRGSYVAVAAPGVDIITTTPGGGYEFMSGTSIATAHITGVVALVLERHPELKAGHIAQLLANASVDLGAKGIDSEFGAGLVDAVEALKSSDEMAHSASAGLTAGQ